MLYARFGAESDVSVFLRSDGLLVCETCSFETIVFSEPVVDQLGFEWDVETGDFVATSAREMLDHLVRHDNADDVLPSRLFARLLHDFRDLDRRLDGAS